MQKLTANDLTMDHVGKRVSFKKEETYIIGKLTDLDPVWCGVAVLSIEGLDRIFLWDNHEVTIFGGI